jgi:hypothetical protein
MNEIRWVYAGDGQVGVRCLQWLIESGLRPVGLLTRGVGKEGDSPLVGLCPFLGSDHVRGFAALATQEGRDWLRGCAVDLIVGISIPELVSRGGQLAPRYGWLRSDPSGRTSGGIDPIETGAIKGPLVEWIGAEPGGMRRIWWNKVGGQSGAHKRQDPADLEQLEFDLFREAWSWVHSNCRASRYSQQPAKKASQRLPAPPEAKPPAALEEMSTGVSVTAGGLRVVDAADEKEWTRVLSRVRRHDLYHTAGYHRLAERNGEGKAQLFVFEEEGATVAIPLLIRPLEGINGGGAAGAQYFDATSVYGYPGPVASNTPDGSTCIETFQKRLTHELHRRGVISVFSRLNPLLSQGELLQGLGEVSFVGNTVSIPLLEPIEMQWAHFRASHRQRIKKLQKQGIQCEEDCTGEYLEPFSEVYLQTMERLNASSYYRFGLPYFRELVRALGSRVHLFVAKAGEKVIAGALFFECGGIVQYHLSGMSNESLKAGAIKLVIDTARRWASEKGFEYLHLGGGVGAGQDSLFHFKAGFSQQRHDFCCWKWVVNEAAYSEVVRSVREHHRLAGLRPSSPNYFPAYRVGTVPSEDLQ